MTEFSAQRKEKIFVIIDEYDHFANELLSFQTDLFSRFVSKTGFVKKWFESIKRRTSTEGSVGRFFATGVSPITPDSLTSGFNIATDLIQGIIGLMSPLALPMQKPTHLLTAV